MISRGFDGDVKIMQEFKMHNRDYIAMAMVGLFSVALMLISNDIIRI